MSPPNVLRVDNLRVRYDRRTVLSVDALTVQPARIHAIIGHNGAGKTTFLEVLSGLLRPSEGRIMIADRAIERADVAYLPTELEFYPMITGAECLTVFATGNPEFRAEQWAEIFDVPLRQLIDTYSLGMRRKLGLIAAIALDRPIIVLDEPMNGLDLAANLLLAQLLKKLAGAGRTIVLTSHALDTLSASCDIVHVMANGHVIATHDSTATANIRSSVETRELDVRMAALDTLVSQEMSSPTRAEAD